MKFSIGDSYSKYLRAHSNQAEYYNLNPRVRIKKKLVLFNTRELSRFSSIGKSTLYTFST